MVAEHKHVVAVAVDDIEPDVAVTHTWPVVYIHTMVEVGHSSTYYCY